MVFSYKIKEFNNKKMRILFYLQTGKLIENKEKSFSFNHFQNNLANTREIKDYFLLKIPKLLVMSPFTLRLSWEYWLSNTTKIKRRQTTKLTNTSNSFSRIIKPSFPVIQTGKSQGSEVDAEIRDTRWW